MQRPQIAPAAFTGPRLEADVAFSFDAAPLALRRTEPAGGTAWAVVVAFHGMNENANAFRLPAAYWAKRGVATIAVDQRGFGRSPNPGDWPGDGLLVRDAETIVALVRAAYPNATLTVLGESMGGAVVMQAAAAGKLAKADRIVLSAPAVWGWSRLNPAYRSTLWLSAHLRPRSFVEPPKVVTRRITPTDNNAILAENWNDPTVLKKTRIEAVYGLVQTMERGAKAAAALPSPTLWLIGAKDEIIPMHATSAAAANAPATVRTIVYPKGYHMLLRDLQAETVWADVLAFMKDPTAPAPSGLAGLAQARTRATSTAQGNP